MTIRNFTVLFLSITALTCATPAWAGRYVRGFGETIEEATKNANSTAEATVRSVGRGCVGVGKDGNPDDAVRVPGKNEAGLWIVEVYISNHNGSCRKMSVEQITLIAITKSAITGR